MASPVRAVEEEVYFQSDYQQQIQDEEILILQGNVEVHFRDVIIYADEVRLNDAKDEFFGVGNIHLISSDRDLYADSIWYNYATDDFDMRNVRGSMIASGVSEPTWFTAERLKGNVDDYKMINGTVTTCSPDEHREYHIEARSIKVLPDNKIIFRNGYLFIVNVPVLWFPYWNYSLAETPWTIQVGKDSFNGTYIKTRYNYLAEETIIGTLIMEYYSRRGYVFGADHQYLVPRHGVGRLNWTYAYRTYRDNTSGEVTHANEYDVKLTQPVRFGLDFSGTFTVSAKSTYNLGRGRNNTFNGSFSGSYRTANTNTSISLSGNSSSGSSQTSSLTTSLSHNRTIFQNVTSSARFEYKVNKQDEQGAADEDFTAHFEFRQSRDNWNWNARIDSYWDPDGFTNIRDRNRSYTNKLPEINITVQPNAFPSRYRNILGFSMQAVNLVGALYYIGPEDEEVNGFYGRLETSFSRTDNLGPSHRIQSNVNYWQAISSTGDARYSYSTSAKWTWDIATKLKWQLDWNRSDNEGRIPLRGYDRAGFPSNRLAWNLTYQNGRLYTIRLSTSYVLNENYQSAPGELWTIDRLDRLNLSVNYTPNRSTTCSLQTSYDFRTGDLADISSSISMTDDRSYRFQTNLTFSPPGSLTRCGTNATFVIGDDLDLRLSTEFAPSASDSIIREISATYRLDCTYLAIQYRAQSDFFGISWGVSAYPQAQIGYDTTEQAFGPDVFNSFQGTGGGFSGFGFQ